MARRYSAISAVLSCLSSLLVTAPLAGQSDGSAPRVFFDCRSPQCDQTYYRTEIDWVSWVRDQADADVYVIMTSQQTGGGGREYLLDLDGRGPNTDFSQQVRYRALSTDTERERLDGVTLTLGLALGQFATHAGYRDLVSVDRVGAQRSGGIVSPVQVDDPWDLWVFRINGNGNFDGQSSRSEWRLSTGLNVDRVTPTWKQSYRASFNRRSERIEFDDREPIEYDRHDWSVNWRVVYALAEHLSAGVSGNVGRNTTNNQDIWGQFNPAIEYSYFPYGEATRRSLTAFYEIGPVYRHYFDVTLYGRTEELRAEQALTLQFSQRQPWGSAGVNLRGSTYLHDLERNNVQLSGDLSFRVMRGFDLNVGASYERVRDQIYLKGGGLTPEERLLRLQQEQTDYRVRTYFGLSYQFGSPFNNVVNNRM
ncbi:MAG TPA: hypothetical protein VMM35_09865 [Longimicrobiales bacterium]|nr:hypothetical protein [Longimicrobiales bacterium]